MFRSICIWVGFIALFAIAGKFAWDNRLSPDYQEIACIDGSSAILDRRTHTLVIRKGDYVHLSNEPYFERLDEVECKLQGDMISTVPVIALKGWGKGQPFYGEYALYSRDEGGNLHPIRP